MCKWKWLLAVVLAVLTATSAAQAQFIRPEDDGMDPWRRGRNGLPKIPGIGSDRDPFARFGMPGRPNHPAQDPFNRWRVPGMAPGRMPVGQRDPDDKKDWVHMLPVHAHLPELSKFKASDYSIPKDVKFTTTSASKGWFSGLRGRVGFWVAVAGAGLGGLFGRKKSAE
jgi:hypothetical protein